MAKIVVVGAGVVGLTTAYELLHEKGANHRVTIVAAQIPTDFDFQTNYTSPFAGADWASFATPGETELQKIDSVALPKFKELARTRPESGVVERVEDHFITKDKFAKSGKKIQLPWYKDLPGVDAKIIPVDNDKFAYGYQFNGVVVSTTYYLSFLWNECMRTGRCDLQRKELKSLDEAFYLHHDGGKADIVVNCSGLRARELVPDPTMYGVRGVTILVENNIKLDKITIVETDEPVYKDETLYIMPRKEGGLVIGGTFSINREGEKFVSDEQCKRILARAAKYVPAFQGKPWHIVRKQVGFRPFRKNGLRIEIDPTVKGLIHCYGHGGGGYQGSWGSAAKVVKLVDQTLGHKSCCCSKL